MTRKELYTKIKEYHLEEDTKRITGKNFTQVSSAELANIIHCHEINWEAKREAENKAHAEKKTSCSCKNAVMTELLATLVIKRILTPDEAEKIADLL